VWQTPGAGEEAVAAMAAMPDADKVALFQSLGVPTDVAQDLAPAVDAEMGRCILALYRSAAQPALAEAGRHIGGVGARVPGLAIVPTDDPYTGGPVLAERMAGVAGARIAGARIARLEGRGHWWMLEDPAEGARVLTEFWRSA
jgi:pimeloyl-ACP methyl ester carboxylesterase